jgi:hypothetical protein
VAFAKKPDAQVLEIPPLEVETAILRLVGDSPLIMNRWSEKAKQEMRDKQQGRAQQKREFKVPEEQWRETIYTLPDGSYGFPSVAFKAAAVDAATQLTGLTKTYLRGAFHIAFESLDRSDLVPILGEPRMREDAVRLQGLKADLHYRAEFPTWEAHVPIRYNPRAITLEKITHLFNQAGFSVGIGEWRPQKDGPFGMFHVDGVTTGQPVARPAMALATNGTDH